MHSVTYLFENYVFQSWINWERERKKPHGYVYVRYYEMLVQRRPNRDSNNIFYLFITWIGLGSKTERGKFDGDFKNDENSVSSFLAMMANLLHHTLRWLYLPSKTYQPTFQPTNHPYILCVNGWLYATFN